MNASPATWTEVDLVNELASLRFCVLRLGEIIQSRPAGVDVSDLFDALTTIRLARGRGGLHSCEEDTEDWCGDLMGAKTVVVESCGVLSRAPRTNRKEWDREALLRAVLDSRLVDPDTGEVVDESPLDRVLHVWNLGAPRTTALRARQIDPDEFCTVERLPGWKVSADG